MTERRQGASNPAYIARWPDQFETSKKKKTNLYVHHFRKPPGTVTIRMPASPKLVPDILIASPSFPKRSFFRLSYPKKYNKNVPVDDTNQSSSTSVEDIPPPLGNRYLFQLPRKVFSTHSWLACVILLTGEWHAVFFLERKCKMEKKRAGSLSICVWLTIAETHGEEKKSRRNGNKTWSISPIIPESPFSRFHRQKRQV